MDFPLGTPQTVGEGSGRVGVKGVGRLGARQWGGGIGMPRTDNREEWGGLVRNQESRITAEVGRAKGKRRECEACVCCSS